MILGEKIPTILIHVTSQCPEFICQEIMWGIEEEGIPYELKILEFNNTLITEAHNSASISLLDVGIACDGQYVVVHYSKLPIDNPMFSQKINNKKQLRIIGKNVACFVKGVPFTSNEIED